MSNAATRQASTLFSEILERVKAEGLLKKKPSFYIVRLGIIGTLASGLWVASGFLGQLVSQDWPWILLGFLIAGLLGILSAQFGFIAHEAALR